MNIQDIIKQNPVLSDPNLTDKLKRWERIRDAVETAYPEATPEDQARVIGEVIEHLEGEETYVCEQCSEEKPRSKGGTDSPVGDECWEKKSRDKATASVQAHLNFPVLLLAAYGGGV